MIADPRLERHRHRLRDAAERVAAGTGEDERNSRRLFVQLCREHGDLFRAVHRTRYGVLLAQLEDDGELVRLYADYLRASLAPERGGYG